MAAKVSWAGSVVCVQPRILMTRSFDQRTRSYLGYLVRIDGAVGIECRSFTLGLSKAAQAKYALRTKDRVAGFAEAPAKPKREPAEFYKVTDLEFLKRADPIVRPAPPFWHLAPDIEVYRQRGMRRIDPRRYAGPCRTCTWGCRMAVEMIVDPWRPSGARRYRTETFCYGPKSCPFYLPGPPRKVLGRNGMTYEEGDWVDAEETSGRGEDE